ncbi:uncharacterized protein LOC127244760 [Andrographis paniculata]|uniref:uncharacterized protein LOC127244760 n=1 Tax=Andrographis paniculata TaxID=175694 RepID=UPI0021E6FE23|nr:uncharacterized protein LOC127244760 [Andrographis paniculata]
MIDAMRDEGDRNLNDDVQIGANEEVNSSESHTLVLSVPRSYPPRATGEAAEPAAARREAREGTKRVVTEKVAQAAYEQAFKAAMEEAQPVATTSNQLIVGRKKLDPINTRVRQSVVVLPHRQHMAAGLAQGLIASAGQQLHDLEGIWPIVVADHVMQPVAATFRQPVVAAIEKSKKFNRQNFETWQQKMLFYLTMLNLKEWLMEDAPVVPEGSSEEQKAQILKAWKRSNFMCKNYVLNGLSDSLYNVYRHALTPKQLWETLEKKYIIEDASTKKFIVGLTCRTVNQIFHLFRDHNLM